MKLLKITSLCILAALLLCLAGCSDPADSMEPDVPKETLANGHLSLVVQNRDELAQLDSQYPELTSLDLSGSTCYEDILNYMNSHPHVAVTYTVPFGGVTADNSEASLTLEAGSCDYETLAANLKYLPNVAGVNLPGTDFSAEQLAALAEAYPQTAVTYTVNILGTEYPSDTTQLDLSTMTSDQVASVAPALSLLPQLTDVELMQSNGSSNLEPADVKVLIDAAPNALFDYSFTLFGKVVSTSDTELKFNYPKLGKDYAERIREALDILQSCTYFMIDAYQYDSAVMAQIREEYPNTEVVWRVKCGKYTFMTDTEVIRAVYNFTDKDGAELKYCNKVKYIDMGHNTSLSDISFVQYMPELEIMIGGGSLVSDLSAFAHCKKLEFLEMAYCEKITDISPLAHCESLKFLNISFSNVTSLVPLDALKLERFYYIQNETSDEEEALFEELHPDCWATFSGVGTDPYTKGWRYEDQGKTRSEIYNKIREVFDLDAVDARIAKQEAAEEDE